MPESEYLGMPISEERGYSHAAAIMAALAKPVADVFMLVVGYRADSQEVLLWDSGSKTHIQISLS